MTEADILFEQGNVWVSRDGRQTFTVWRNGPTHATSDSSYADQSLAIARAMYLAKREGMR